MYTWEKTIRRLTLLPCEIQSPLSTPTENTPNLEAMRLLAPKAFTDDNCEIVIRTSGGCLKSTALGQV